MSGTSWVPFARPWNHASEPALTEMCPGASRGIVFNQASEPSTMTYCYCWCCSCWCVRTLEWYTVTKVGRWVLCSCWSLGPRPLIPTGSCLAAEWRGDYVRASCLYSLSNASIATLTSVCTSECCWTTRLRTVRCWLVKARCFSSIRKYDGPSVQI